MDASAHQIRAQKSKQQQLDQNIASYNNNWNPGVVSFVLTTFRAMRFNRAKLRALLRSDF
jgi:hypothetical protein